MHSPIRGSTVFLRADLEAMLRAVAVTNALAARAGTAKPDYTAGFNAALMAFSLMLGIGDERDYRGLMGR